MQQVGTVIREVTQEFEWHAQDAGIAEEEVKFHLVLVLNQKTLSHLDAYITMCSGDKMACLETVQDRLRHILYVQMLAYLK